MGGEKNLHYHLLMIQAIRPIAETLQECVSHLANLTSPNLIKIHIDKYMI